MLKTLPLVVLPLRKRKTLAEGVQGHESCKRRKAGDSRRRTELWTDAHNGREAGLVGWAEVPHVAAQQQVHTS